MTDSFAVRKDFSVGRRVFIGFPYLTMDGGRNSGRLRLRRKSAPPIQRVPLSSNQQTGIVPIKAK
jgi:hypothetical protein